MFTKDEFGSALKGRRILVVDDEPHIREILVKLLKTCGAIVHEASGGIEAMNLLNFINVDLVLSDLQMPLGDGVDLLLQMRMNHRCMAAFVFITGTPASEELLWVQERAQGLIAKPFSLRDVVQTLAKILGEVSVDGSHSVA